MKQLLNNMKLTALTAFMLLVAMDTFALEKIVVQTLSYDSITTRRGTWQFPDNPDEYRKIYMYYKLKCDPLTYRDQYHCGEWDYLTHTFVYKHTGVMDSSLTEHPLYKIGRQSPDTIRYSNTELINNFQYRKFNTEVTSVISEDEYQAGDENADLAISDKNVRMQFLYKKNDLKDAGLSKGNIHGVKFYLKSAPITLKNLKIGLKNTNSKTTDMIDNIELVTYHYDDITVQEEGWHTIYFNEPFDWNGLFSVLFDISYSIDEDTEDVIWGANAVSGGIISAENDTFLEFDGTYDYVEATDIPEINGVQKVTYETWVKINKWKNWADIITKNNKLVLQCGGSEREVYCIVRPALNQWGRAEGVLQVGQWTHIAMVFDGSGESNNDKLKLFINGREIGLIYKHVIPSYTPVNNEPVKISSTIGNNSMIDGCIDDVRIWNDALSNDAISEWLDKDIDETHPNYSNLQLYYDMENIENGYVIDKSGKERNGRLIGMPAVKQMYPADYMKNSFGSENRPAVVMLRGEYETRVNESVATISEQLPQLSIVKFKKDGHRAIVDELINVEQGGWGYTYDPDGNRIDSSYSEKSEEIYNDVITYYTEPAEILDRYEIARFITPYGKMLDLGPDGFEWRYDVTEYAHLLTGEVDMSAGNQQELLDVRFEFIKGTPPRKVLSVDRIWGPMKSYRYSQMDNDDVLSEIEVPILDDAETFKIKTRLTGHGHHSNDGEYPHCCEWKDNDHYLLVNNDEFSWKIFQYYECAMNPVYPQGGTWPGAREGWCPGDVVKDFEFELTGIVTKPTTKFDYGITPVPANNKNMGNGNYVTSMHFIQYSAPTHEIDAELYDIISPNSWDYYSRINPICSEPTIIVRNNGSEPITSLNINIGVSGGDPIDFNWTGNIEPMRFDTIYIPITSSAFWHGDEQRKFTATVSDPNGKQDQYAENDTYTSRFKQTDMYTNSCEVRILTNLRGSEFSVEILDYAGNVVKSGDNFQNNSLYTFNFAELEEGCYTLRVLDQRHYGLSYWAIPDQGNGYLRIVDGAGEDIHVFDPDFGIGVFYSFRIGDMVDVPVKNDEFAAELYPNPATSHVDIHVPKAIGPADMYVYDLEGNVIETKSVNMQDDSMLRIEIDNYVPGTYFVRLLNDKFDIRKQFIKN